jgi:hypothetical protein
MLVSSLRLLTTLFWRAIVFDETGIQGGTLRSQDLNPLGRVWNILEFFLIMPVTL